MRFRQMDGLRAAAALAVVMIHVSAGRMNPVGVFFNQLTRFAVPLFFLCSGALLNMWCARQRDFVSFSSCRTSTARKYTRPRRKRYGYKEHQTGIRSNR